MRAVYAGALTLDRERWSAAVDSAVTASEQRQADLALDFRSDTPPRSHKLELRHVVLEPGAVVLDAQMVLDLERALVEAEQMVEEIETLAKEDVSEARRARLLRTIEQCREAVARKLRGRGMA